MTAAQKVAAEYRRRVDLKFPRAAELNAIADVVEALAKAGREISDWNDPSGIHYSGHHTPAYIETALAKLARAVGVEGE